MAKNKTKKTQEVKNLCLDCERLKIDTVNIDFEGKPFSGYCFIDGLLKLMSNNGCHTNFRRKV